MLNLIMAGVTLVSGIAALVTGEWAVAAILFGIGYLITEVS